jgi:chloramphenicol 3-O-phosphotransferase
MPARRTGGQESSVTGRVVLLHGTASSGKTTVAPALQALSEEPWLRLGIDAFWTAIDERWMEHGSRASGGFLTVDTDSQSPEECARAVLEAVARLTSRSA